MKVEFSVRMHLLGCTRKSVIDVPDDELEGLSEQERDKYIDEYAQDWLWEQIEYGWKEAE
jgi:hypothetical protein